MARLPSEMWLIQQIGGRVILFQEGTECEIVNYNPSSSSETMQALKTISESEDLDNQDKSLATFWCGYFYAHNAGDPM